LPIANAIGPGALMHEYATHTEPRISFHEPTGHYVVAYPDLTSEVRILVLNENGIPVSATTSMKMQSTLPVEIACQTHRSSPSTSCFVYAHVNSGNYNAAHGAFIRKSFTLSNAGVATVNHDNVVESAPHVALLIDAGTFGQGIIDPAQMPDGYFVSTTPFRITTPSEIRFLVDNVGAFTSLVGPYAQSYMTFAGWNPAGLRPNVSSFDWNEQLLRFVIVGPT
jgi:hypothetical protein